MLWVMAIRHGTGRNAGPDAIARAFVPSIPLPAVFSFALIGFGGALFLSYSFFPGADSTSSARSPNDVPVYSARAVPRDSERAALPEQSVIAARSAAVAQTESERTQAAEQASSHSLVAESPRVGFTGFDGFSNSNVPNSYLALAGVPSAVGISAESNSSVHSAQDALSLSSVPEPSTWLAGAALVGLVGGRWLRSKWRRSQRH
jgi:hypothetical protein